MNMSWTRKVAGGTGVAAALTVSLALAGPAAGAGAAGARVVSAGVAALPAQVRVNQVGYTTDGSKEAFAMLPVAAGPVSFTVSDGRHVVFRGTSTRNAGRWNANYPATYALEFGGLTRPGTYRITATAAGVHAASPAFRVASPGALYSQLTGNAVRYFTSERDGADVRPSVLDRQAANLTDEQATVYADPAYDSR